MKFGDDVRAEQPLSPAISIGSFPMSAPSLRRTVVRRGGFAAGGSLLTQVVALGSYVVLARLAAPEVFGIFAAASIFIGVGALVAESGMTAALVRRSDRLEEAAATAFVSSIAGGVALALLALALAPVAGLVFGEREIAVIAAALAGTLILGNCTIVPDALLQRRFSILRRLVVEPGSFLVFGAVSAVALAEGLGAWGLVIGTYAHLALRATAIWAIGRWRPNLALASVAMWRELVAYARYVLAGGMLAEAGRAATTAIIGRGLGVAPLGHFRFAWRLVSQANTPIVNGAAYVLLPAFSRISSETSRFANAFHDALRTLSLLAFPISFLFFPLGEPIAVLVLGEPWRPAGRVMMALCLVGAGHALTSIASEAFKGSGHPEILPRMHLLGAIVPVALLVALLPLGAVGAGAAFSIGTVVAAAYALRQVARIVDVPSSRLLAAIAPATAASLAMAAGLYGVEHLLIDASSRGQVAGLVLLTAEVVLGAVMYASVVAFVWPGRAREALGLLRAATPAAVPVEVSGEAVGVPPASAGSRSAR